jgi:glucose-6-phosphate isomerase
MFAGHHINSTEDRAVLHVALRNPAESHGTESEGDVMPEIKHELARMGAFTHAVQSGSWTGSTGKKIKHVVNIGIGGSDLGPKLAYEALYGYRVSDLTVHFVSNIDSADFIENVSSVLDPEETLFIIVSKTFTTDETMTNALAARLWITDKLGENAVDTHFVAVSSNVEKVASFGIGPSATFQMWDWVGGRYSLVSAVGLALMISIGADRFNQLLEGMHAVDEHFRTTSLEENMPVMMGLLSIWYSNFFHSSTELISPYSYNLRSFPSYIQQLSMESNGKLIRKDGGLVDCHTAPVVWGQSGTNAQHSYFQLLHQGTHMIPTTFIGFKQSLHQLGEHNRKLIGNMLAQSEALAFGRSVAQLQETETPQELLLHKAMPGNRPNSVLVSEELTPKSLGSLLALFEHKTFVQGVIWGVNSFDQWGVEYGKVLAKSTSEDLKQKKPVTSHDDSTNALINRMKS